MTYVLTNEKSNDAHKQELAQTSATATDTVIESASVDMPPGLVKTDGKNGSLNAQQLTVTIKDQQANGFIATIDPQGKTDSSFVYRPSKIQPSSINKSASGVTDETVTGNTNTTAPVPSSNNNSNNAIASENSKLETETKKMETSDRKKAKQKNAADNKTQLNTQSFTARVETAGNKPVPFSNISIPKENLNTYADVNGNFRLESKEKSLDVDVRAAGYLTQTYTLQDKSDINTIVLEEEKSDAKEQAFAKARKSTEDRISRDTRLIFTKGSNAEPAVGQNLYNTYIANNIKLPEAVIKNNIHGEIDIFFSVNSLGTISNLIIAPSNCTDCDAMIKNLIEKGPTWKLKKGKEASVKLKLLF